MAQLTLRLPDELRTTLDDLADQRNSSLNALIQECLEAHVDNHHIRQAFTSYAITHTRPDTPAARPPRATASTAWQLSLADLDAVVAAHPQQGLWWRNRALAADIVHQVNLALETRHTASIIRAAASLAAGFAAHYPLTADNHEVGTGCALALLHVCGLDTPATNDTFQAQMATILHSVSAAGTVTDAHLATLSHLLTPAES